MARDVGNDEMLVCTSDGARSACGTHYENHPERLNDFTRPKAALPVPSASKNGHRLLVFSMLLTI